MMNRYTPIPPISQSIELTSDDEDEDSELADADSDDDARAGDEETQEIDEDFVMSGQYEEVKPVMKKRMLELSELDTFDNQVSYRRGFQPVVRGSPVVRGELPRGPRATLGKLETCRILTKQKYRPYQCCRYGLQRT